MKISIVEVVSSLIPPPRQPISQDTPTQPWTMSWVTWSFTMATRELRTAKTAYSSQPHRMLLAVGNMQAVTQSLLTEARESVSAHSKV